ncbi:hypothetical protein ACGGZK_17380 [Agromyces sp. MMS24-K17]|uniref:hypothetical protein n=1 Tax=Agromyces sp. MMS24-K17 TaxID=3372850 RepID=UPI0037543D77
MILDTYTLQLALTVVTTVSGVLFLLDAFLRQADAAGRVWSLGFVSGIVCSFSLSVLTLYPTAWWTAVAAATTNVFAVAAFWSGARAYNRRRDLLWVGVVVSLAIGAAVVLGSVGLIGSAGLALLYASVASFAALGLVESLRSPMSRHWTARGLSVIFAFVAAFYGARTVVVLLLGADAEVMQTLLGRGAAAVVVMALTITTVVCMTILQGERVPRVGERGSSLEFTADGLLTRDELLQIADDWAERADFHGDQLVVLRFELDERESLDAAFGRSTGLGLAGDFAAVVRRYAGAHTIVAEEAPGQVLVAGVYRHLADATDSAEEIRHGLRDERITAADGIRLTASVGIVGSDRHGYDVITLVDAATSAAQSARAAGGDVVVEG